MEGRFVLGVYFYIPDALDINVVVGIGEKNDAYAATNHHVLASRSKEDAQQ